MLLFLFLFWIFVLFVCSFVCLFILSCFYLLYLFVFCLFVWFFPVRCKNKVSKSSYGKVEILEAVEKTPIYAIN